MKRSTKHQDVDDETRQLLLSVTADIQRLLADDEGSVAPDESLSEPGNRHDSRF